MDLLQRKAVLVADDDTSLRLLLRATLGPTRCLVREAADGVEALDIARRERPDLVLLDVGMPRLDGYAVCRALKDDPCTADIKVMMLTARAEQADRELGLEAGADAYITKPFSPRDLLSNVERLLG